MAEFFEYDPITGIKTETAYDEMTGDLHIIRTSDEEALLKYTTQFRNEAGKNSEDIKNGWWLYAKLSPMQILKMRQAGINVFDQNDGPAMFRYINEHLPHLKTTTGKEGKSSAPIYFMPQKHG